jgi:predicted transcriptional regulator
MARLGELERAVMEVLWHRAPAAVTARQVADGLPDRDLAQTTVLTVLSRLERKGMVTRQRSGRAHSYLATSSRADHVAALMHEALGTAADGAARAAVLVRFAGQASAEDAAALQSALDQAERRRHLASPES